MKGQGGTGQAQALRDITGHEAFGTCFNEQAENRKACDLTEGGQGGSGMLYFHISRIIEYGDRSKRA